MKTTMPHTTTAPDITGGSLIEHAARAVAAAERFTVLWSGANSAEAERSIEPEAQDCDGSVSV